jgi:hypothetical protein
MFLEEAYSVVGLSLNPLHLPPGDFRTVIITKARAKLTWRTHLTYVDWPVARCNLID